MNGIYPNHLSTVFILICDASGMDKSLRCSVDINVDDHTENGDISGKVGS
jgi:hypothetical protein